MELDREKRVLDIFCEALARPNERRADFLRESCGGDETLRAEAEALLARDARENGAAIARTPVSLVTPYVGRGLVLDDFRLERLVGEGGSGQVWEAEQLSLKRRVAVKLLKHSLWVHAERERFRMEAETAGRLDHEGIVTVYASGEVDGYPYIAQELIRDGQDLGQWVAERRRRGRDPDHVRWVAGRMAAVAEAVQAAHEAGIVHRDLKPQNIILRADGRPVIVDFGIAGLMAGGQGTVTRSLVGSTPYMAPEQIERHEVGKDPLTDVYELGVTLYELLTLQPAFAGRTRNEIESKIVRGEFRRPRAVDRAIPRAIQDVCLKAMSLRPKDRYATAGELGDDLSRFVSGRELPLAARGPRVVKAAKRLPCFVRRHRVRLAGAAVGILTALLIYVYANQPDASSKIRGLRWTGFAGLPGTPEAGAEQSRVLYREATDEVLPGDYLGFEASLERSASVYMLSIWGERSTPSMVRPMEPMITEHGPGATPHYRRLDSSEWGARLENGSYRVIATKIGETSDGPYEGVLVLMTDEPRSNVETLFSRLRETGSGVRWEHALGLWDDILQSTRGRQLEGDPAIKDFMASLPPEGAFEREWEERGFQVFWFMLRVEGETEEAS